MDAFTCTGPLFRHTIAAHDFETAHRVAQAELGGGRVILWSTPDVWTRRAIEAATLPGVVDAVPRFIVERGRGFSGIVELDHDAIPGNLRPGETDRLRRDSADHAAWLDAFEAVHAGGKALREHVVRVATERDAATFTRLARALAGAYGLGPVPVWHAAILPALVALDVETTERGWPMVPDTFERAYGVSFASAVIEVRAECGGFLARAADRIALAMWRYDRTGYARTQTVMALADLGWTRRPMRSAIRARFVSA